MPLIHVLLSGIWKDPSFSLPSASTLNSSIFLQIPLPAIWRQPMPLLRPSPPVADYNLTTLRPKTTMSWTF